MLKNTNLLVQAAEELLKQGFELDMSYFQLNNGSKVHQTELEQPCGATGCALGTMPFLGIDALALDISDKAYGIVFWSRYSLRVFGIENGFDDGNVWGFLFDAGWECLEDNTAVEFYERAKYVHENQCAPDDWNYAPYLSGWQ